MTSVAVSTAPPVPAFRQSPISAASSRQIGQAATKPAATTNETTTSEEKPSSFEELVRSISSNDEIGNKPVAANPAIPGLATPAATTEPGRSPVAAPAPATSAASFFGPVTSFAPQTVATSAEPVTQVATPAVAAPRNRASSGSHGKTAASEKDSQAPPAENAPVIAPAALLVVPPALLTFTFGSAAGVAEKDKPSEPAKSQSTKPVERVATQSNAALEIRVRPAGDAALAGNDVRDDKTSVAQPYPGPLTPSTSSSVSNPVSSTSDTNNPTANQTPAGRTGQAARPAEEAPVQPVRAKTPEPVIPSAAPEAQQHAPAAAVSAPRVTNSPTQNTAPVHVVQLTSQSPAGTATTRTTAGASAAIYKQEPLPERAESTQPLRSLALEFTPDGANDVKLRLSEHAGEVHVSVHSADPALSGRLHDGINDLVGSLSSAGYDAEAWTPSQGRQQQQQPDEQPRNPRGDHAPSASDQFSGLLEQPLQENI